MKGSGGGTKHPSPPAQLMAPVKVSPSGATVALMLQDSSNPKVVHWTGSDKVKAPVVESIVPVRGPGWPAVGGVCVRLLPACVNWRTSVPVDHRPVMLMVACADATAAASAIAVREGRYRKFFTAAPPSIPLS